MARLGVWTIHITLKTFEIKRCFIDFFNIVYLALIYMGV